MQPVKDEGENYQGRLDKQPGRGKLCAEPLPTPMKFLQLKFIPQSTDFALLLLRLVSGLTILIFHGWGKLASFGDLSTKFPDVIGIGSAPTLVLAILAEVVAAALLTVGYLTRFAALLLSITMGVAFFVAHGAKLSGPGNGELAFVYLAAFLTILFAGAGRFALDGKKG